MNNFLRNLTEIKGGLSKKKIFRKYEKKISKIVIDFSKDEKKFNNFINVYEILKKLNISIPKVYEVHSNKKIIIVEDFGNNNFDKIFKEHQVYSLLKLAVDNLIIIQNSLVEEDLNKLNKYTYNDLKNEISEFVDYYIPYKKISNFQADRFYQSWENSYNSQKFDFSSLIHKDFEFINLILLNENNLHLKCGIIDFQSAFIGFKGWDLFSILENPRINFTRKYNEDLIKFFYESITINNDFFEFRNQYYLLNLCRQSRLLGRWIKLFKNGKKEYLKYVNITTKRIISSMNNLPSSDLKTIYENIFIN